MRTKISTLGLSSKSIKTPWHLRLAPTVKGIISFVQNLLPSRTPKEASAAAILAGIGLLTAPMEQAQAAVPTVSEVIVSGWVVFDSGRFDMEVVHSEGSGPEWDFIKYCWSGIYKDDEDDRGWKWKNAEDYDFEAGYLAGYHSEEPDHDHLYYYPAFRNDYYICKMVAKNPATGEMDKSFGWVEVWFYTGYYYQNGEYVPPSAFVSDSEGQLLRSGFNH